ncbi:hypothetical protein [Maridesulfovibrio sp.]|uniref:hypothetical protein n=1 Tax=Maridesulfovibrio sp. TaxID=2795000 RepID=UPI0039EF06D4
MSLDERLTGAIEETVTRLLAIEKEEFEEILRNREPGDIYNFLQDLTNREVVLSLTNDNLFTLSPDTKLEYDENITNWEIDNTFDEYSLTVCSDNNDTDCAEEVFEWAMAA